MYINYRKKAMFFSHDNKIIIKQISLKKINNLEPFFTSYYEHLLNKKHSFLNKIFRLMQVEHQNYSY